jgi:hypothetical protein
LNTSRGEWTRGGRAYLVTLATASIVILAFLLFALGDFNSPVATSSSSSTTSASYQVEARYVIASAAALLPAGYATGSAQQLNASEPGLRDGAYTVLSSRTGSSANLTILVFDEPGYAQTYIASVVSNAKGLIGYSDVSAVLATYQHYGLCYGYGQDDPDGNGSVVTGICTRGNVYIQVHLVSHSPLASAKQDVSSLVGAAYNGFG